MTAIEKIISAMEKAGCDNHSQYSDRITGYFSGIAGSNLKKIEKQSNKHYMAVFPEIVNGVPFVKVSMIEDKSK